MPSRILRDRINSSGRINALSSGAELFYRRLMSVVDDYGRYYGHVSTLRTNSWPTCPDKFTDRQVKAWLSECTSGDRPLIRLYSVDGCPYIEFDDFGQRERGKSKFPSPQVADSSPPLRGHYADNPPSNDSESADNPPQDVGLRRNAGVVMRNAAGGYASSEPAAAEVAWVREVLCDYAEQCGVNLGAPPDDAICLQVLKLGDSHRLNPAIRAMFDAGKRPAKSWAFFPTVLPQFISQVSHGSSS